MVNLPVTKFWSVNRSNHFYVRWNGNESTNATARFPSTWNAAIPKSPRMGNTPVGHLHLQILYAGYCIVQLSFCSYHYGYESGNHSKYCTFGHFRMKYAFRQAHIPRPLFCSRGARHDKSRSYSNSPCSHFVVAANDLGLIRRKIDFSFCGFWPLGRPGILSIVSRVSSRQICQLRNSRTGRIIFIGNEKNCSGMDELVHQCLLSGSMSMSAELVV